MVAWVVGMGAPPSGKAAAERERGDRRICAGAREGDSDDAVEDESAHSSASAAEEMEGDDSEDNGEDDVEKDGFSGIRGNGWGSGVWFIKNEIGMERVRPVVLVLVLLAEAAALPAAKDSKEAPASFSDSKVRRSLWEMMLVLVLVLLRSAGKGWAPLPEPLPRAPRAMEEIEAYQERGGGVVGGGGDGVPPLLPLLFWSYDIAFWQSAVDRFE